MLTTEELIALRSVKPLRWQVYCANTGNCEASTAFGPYVVECCHEEGWGMWTPKEQGGGDDPGHGYYDSIEAAQAAAEAHWAAACNTAPDLLAEVIRLRAREAAGAKLALEAHRAANRLDWCIGLIQSDLGRDKATAWPDELRAVIVAWEAAQCPPQT